MWFLYSLVAGLCYTGSGLITRYVLKKHADPWAFSLYFSVVGALVSLPFMLGSIKIATSWPLLALAFGVSAAIVFHNLLNFTSAKYLEASVQGIVQKLRLVWTFLFGILLLHEGFSLQKFFGTVCAVFAGVLIINHFKKPESLKGVVFAASATVVYSSVLVAYKFLFQGFNSVTLTFFVTFLVPAILNAAMMPNMKNRVLEMFRLQGLWVFVACAFGGVANLAMNQALSLGQVSKVPVVIETFLVLTLVGEHVWLKEREGLRVKILAVILAVFGTALVKL